MEQETIHPEYIKGFNDGYMLAKYTPELADKLAQVETTSPRIEGLKDGRERFAFEENSKHRSSWLKKDRSSVKDDKELTDRDFDKD